ncbi:hypothetical protein L7F22_060511 [Adiantum nelumboides]|nr:hypothetical protein [Adiantum nelumboides]
MFSPIRQTRREATEDDEIPLENPITLKDGTVTKSFKVSKGDVIYIPLHSLNVESDTWGPDSEVFRPERWLEPDHQYYEEGLYSKAKDLKTGWKGLQTFAVGPRNCIGMRMAVLEINCVIANVITNFQINPPELKGEEKVNVGYRLAVVARPCVQGRENEGHLLPLRITKL